jgi:hypothetical protein
MKFRSIIFAIILLLLAAVVNSQDEAPIHGKPRNLM